MRDSRTRWTNIKAVADPGTALWAISWKLSTAAQLSYESYL